MKILFIIPYFGKFNNYFQFFLNSCEKNSDIADWLIITDDKRAFNYPSNVKVQYTTFTKLRGRIQKTFPFDVRLDRPYKLCDFRPTYGYVFKNEIATYDFWGHCDVDIIFGKLSHFLTGTLLNDFKKLFVFGHCTIYKNEEEINTLFLKPLNGIERAKQVLQDTNNCSFDEEFAASINNLFEEYKVPIFTEEFQANTYTKSSLFRLTALNKHHRYEIEKVFRNFFVWDQGVLLRYFISNHDLVKKEYMYIHFQARPMMVKNIDTDCKCYKIIPNQFDKVEVYPITLDTFFTVKWRTLNLHYFKLRSKNLYVKICRYFNRLIFKRR